MSGPVEKIDPKTRARSILVPLTEPITINDGKTQIYQVEIGRIKVKHLKILPDSFLNPDIPPSPSELRLIVIALTGLKEEEADQIDYKDVYNIVLQGMTLLK